MRFMIKTSLPLFWRDARMPYIEARQIEDGRQVGYHLHSHSSWSLGALVQGTCTFIYRDHNYYLIQGDLVLINPEWPHACNPIAEQSWGYIMVYIDKDWLTALRYSEGLLEQPIWQDIANVIITNEDLYQNYCEMVACLFDNKRELLDKQTHVVDYLSTLMHSLNNRKIEFEEQTPSVLKTLAEYLEQHCTEELSLDDLCLWTGYSPSHLIRRFKHYFGLTPHAYIVNKRIQYSQHHLKKGLSIAETALNAGFADQAHFQRTFKRLVAATPNQYRQSTNI